MAPDVSLAGSHVYVVWQEHRGGPPQVFFNRSTDGGASWLANDVRVNRNVLLPWSASTSPRVASVGQTVYVVWDDTRNAGGQDVFFNVSTDGGSSWLAADVRLNTNAPGATRSFLPRIAAQGQDVYVVWEDDRNGPHDVYFNRSTDGGATWLAADVRLDTDFPGAAPSLEPRIAASGSTVHVVWGDFRVAAGDVRYNRSTDGGATWLAADARLDTDLPGAYHSLHPAISADGSHVRVVWEEYRNGAADVYANASSDGGATWFAQDRRVDAGAPGSAASVAPVVTGSGADVRVAWLDDRDGLFDVRFARSTDGGASWSTDVRLSSAPAGTAVSMTPDLASDQGYVYAVWSDGRSGASDVRLNASSDGGATWLASDVRIDTDTAGAAGSLAPRVVCAGRSVRVVWGDRRNGLDDVFFNRSDPP
jgi:hypothetical protein